MGRLPAGSGEELGGSDVEPTVEELKIAVVAIDFADQPFVITQPKQCDPFGNPQIDGIPRASVPQFYADFYGKPSALNHGHTINEYWMEQTHGRIGMTFTPYGPYRMPRPLYEYGLNEFNQNGATAAERPTGGGCPTGRTLRRQHEPRRRRALARPTCAEAERHQFDLVLRIYAGYDETTVWQEFGEMKFETKEEIPERLGPPGPAASPTGSPTATCRGPRGAPARSSGATPRSARARARARSRTRSSTPSACRTTTTTRTSTPYHRVGSGPVGHPRPRLVQRSGRPAQALAGAGHAGRRDGGRHDAADQAQEGWFAEADVHARHPHAGSRHPACSR